jgi:hypothetical protein
MRFFPRLTAVAGILFCSIVAMGQTSFTSVRGTVTDPSGAILPGAKVELANVANGQSATQLANEQGEYRFPQLVPGTYMITVSSSGFGTESKRAELLVNQPATVNFSLSIQSSTVTVDVSAQAQTLNDADATIGNALNNATIAALPSEGRNVPDLLSVQPGVLYLGGALISRVTAGRGRLRARAPTRPMSRWMGWMTTTRRRATRSRECCGRLSIRWKSFA